MSLCGIDCDDDYAESGEISYMIENWIYMIRYIYVIITFLP